MVVSLPQASLLSALSAGQQGAKALASRSDEYRKYMPNGVKGNAGGVAASRGSNITREECKSLNERDFSVEMGLLLGMKLQANAAGGGNALENGK